MGYLTQAQPAAQARQVNTQVKDDSLVEKRMTGLLDSDSKYMKQAETRGNQQAQSRGLLSSSLAVGAVENSRIAAALPIAQQDAQLLGTRDLQDGAYNQQGALNEQSYSNQSRINDQSFGQQIELNEQTFGQSRQLNQDQFGYNSQLNAQQNSAQAQLQRDNQVAEIMLNANNEIAAFERDPTMSPEARNIAIQNTLNLQRASIATIQRGQVLANTTFTYPSAQNPAQSRADRPTFRSNR